MPHPRPLLPALLCAAAVGASACRDASGPEDDLRVVTSVQPAEFRAGSTVTVTTTVTNAGARTRVLSPPQPCEDAFTLTNAGGAVVPPARRFCNLMAVANVDIGPGEQRVFTQRWRGDVGPGTTSGRDDLLPPGAYRLRGYVRAVERRRTEFEAVLVTAPPVTIGVLP